MRQGQVRSGHVNLKTVNLKTDGRRLVNFYSRSEFRFMHNFLLIMMLFDVLNPKMIFISGANKKSSQPNPGRHQVLTSRENPSPLSMPCPSLWRLLRSRSVELQIFWKFRIQLVLDLKSSAWHSNIYQSTRIYCLLIDPKVGGQ